MNTSREKFAQFLEAQRAEYRRSLPDKMASIDTLWAQAQQDGAAGHEALVTLHRVAHTIHGTAGTYGFRPTGDAAHALEEAAKALSQAGAATPELRARVEETIAALRLTLPGPG